ncbi:MAG: glycoside hydrolase family 16 protein [Fibrobacteres bacterium]|jgi:beta-glucanase (GH16 family)|nr:glycoside hydrolase family 16 protein [Fibrobacterota bacterium]
MTHSTHRLLGSTLVLVCIASMRSFPADPTLADTDAPPDRPGMKLVWSEEFAKDGAPDPAVWNFEKGFARNEELQWYQSQNATCKGGVLRIEGRKERLANPNYAAGSSSWKTNRQYAEYTSSSLSSSGKKQFQYGKWEVRARLDGQSGSWPAIWTLGASGEWPTNGEVDLMEFYPNSGAPALHANVAWGTATRWSAKWSSKVRSLSSFTSKDPDWLKKFHVWTMDWNADTVKLSLDGQVLNTTLTSQTINADGTNPYRDRPQYMMLNLAMGANGGDPSKGSFPMVYEVDYVRVYQKGANGVAQGEPARESLLQANRTGDALRFRLPATGDFRARVMDLSGRIVREQAVTGSEGCEQTLTLDGQTRQILILELEGSAGDWRTLLSPQ